MIGQIHSPSEIGTVVRSQRERHNLNQRELAARLGISQTYLSQLERGTPKVLDQDYLDVLRRLGIRLKFEIVNDDD